MSWFDDPRTLALEAIVAYYQNTAVDGVSRKAAPHINDAQTELKDRGNYELALEHAEKAAAIDQVRAGRVKAALESVVLADQAGELPDTPPGTPPEERRDQ